MSPTQLTAGFMGCLLDVLHPLTLDGGFSRGPPAVFRARVVSKSSLGVPANRSDEDPIFGAIADGLL